MYTHACPHTPAEQLCEAISTPRQRQSQRLDLHRIEGGAPLLLDDAVEYHVSVCERKY